MGEPAGAKEASTAQTLTPLTGARRLLRRVGFPGLGRCEGIAPDRRRFFHTFLRPGLMSCGPPGRRSPGSCYADFGHEVLADRATGSDGNAHALRVPTKTELRLKNSPSSTCWRSASSDRLPDGDRPRNARPRVPKARPSPHCQAPSAALRDVPSTHQVTPPLGWIPPRRLRLLAWPQNFRRLVVRYERYTENFLGMLTSAAV